MVLFVFGSEDTTSTISKNNLKCGLGRPQNTFPLCTSPSVSGWCWYMTFTLHSRVLTCTYRCCLRTVFTDNGFVKCSWAHVVISFTHLCRVLMQGRPRYQRSWAFSVGFRPCHLCTEISPDSVNLWMILWAILRNVLELLEVFSHSCWQSGVPRPILACEWLSL